ncbi:ribonuclease R family protein [Mycoplasma struthionis]|uniref:ribonuclease R family protein n=1 Tax=Mycoplasma struthionis TaxID=538220 RepID=UPI0021BD71EE|nr:VacB/RNase II family 3'-5' exoribonuclease [Mycoplasma struthionis]
MIKHKKQIVSGTISKNKNIFFFKAYDSRDAADYRIISDFKTLENFTEKDILVFNIKEPNSKFVIIEFSHFLTKIDDKELPIKNILSSNDVQSDFPEEVLIEAKNMPLEIQKEDFENRKDLTNILTVTIDGLDTKDFDDAISCFKLENNNYKLYIHIADVSYYVKEGSAIDLEALKRGTSIYLPDRVIPMLPFSLSNGICSLNPNVNRACLTLELEIDNKGNNISSEIYPSIIKSDARLTYKQVNELFENKEFSLNKEISDMLNCALSLTKLIRDKKIAEGYVDFEIKESKVIMEGNKVVDIKIREDGISEKMIEDFMVRANEVVAEKMQEKQIPSIYRIHDCPSLEKLQNLQTFLNYLNLKGCTVPLDNEPLSFAKVVAKIKEQNFDDFVKMTLLQTMQKAKYSAKNIGHFGLASKAYSHFTSPIRRYPDLLLHRLIKKYLLTNKEFKNEEYEALESKIEHIAQLNSESEKEAMTIERDIVDIRKAQFFENLINKEFLAPLVSIQKFGLFFNIEEYQASVLIRFENFEDGTLKISDFEAKGQNNYFKVGNKYKIKITSIENDKGNINAVVAK